MAWKRNVYKVKRAIARLVKQAKMLALIAAVAAPVAGSRAPSLLEQIQEQGKLVVISRNGPTTYYEDSEGYTGFEYSLLSAFAAHIDVELEIVEEEDLDQMMDNLGESGHFAAAGLSITPKRQRAAQFSTPYLSITQQLIYRSGSKRPKSVEDLLGKQIVVIGGSAHAERLRELQREYPTLSWEERYDVEMLDLLEMVHNKKVEYAIVDSNARELNSGLYPKAKVAFNISDEEAVAWAFPVSSDTSLLDAANEFLSEFEQSGRLAEINDTFYGHLGKIDYSGALVFKRRMESRLPQWEAPLKEAAENTGLDWLLLAALSYQESHWNPKAKSPTGVRGFMMLTRRTAKEMKIQNRLDPLQSIKGGSEYFRKLVDRIPETVSGPDRLWFALAAYNVGYGHLQDARGLTQQHGGNPNIWGDVMQYLPLLTQRQYYKHTKHGFARGQEAVSYVQNIRNFYGILAWDQVQQERSTQIALNEAKEEDSEFNSVISDVVANQLFASSAALSTSL